MSRSKGLNTSKINSFYALILFSFTKALERAGRSRNIFHSRCKNGIFKRKPWNLKACQGFLLPASSKARTAARPPVRLSENREPGPASAGSGSPLDHIQDHLLAARYWNMT